MNLTTSCNKRISDICTGVAFQPMEKRYYQGFFIALCHNMSLLFNILNDSFLGPCPLSLVCSEDSGTPNEWNNLFNLVTMFNIPNRVNITCQSKQFTYTSILQHCRDKHNFGHQGVFIFMKTVFSTIQEHPDFMPYLRLHCKERYSKQYEKNKKLGGCCSNILKYDISKSMTMKSRTKSSKTGIQNIVSPYGDSDIDIAISDSDDESSYKAGTSKIVQQKSRSS